MGPYGKYLRQAFEITRLYKTLWFTGLFLIIFEVASFIVTSWLDGREQDISPTMMQIGLLLIILLSIIVYRAKAAAIINIKSITDKKPLTAGRGWTNAGLFFWRIFGVSWGVQIVAVVICLLISFPLLALQGHINAAIWILLIILGAAIVLPVLVVSCVINIFAPMFVVLYDQTMKEAVNKAYGLVDRFWSQLLPLMILLFLVQTSALFFAQFMLKLTSGLMWTGIIVSAVIYLVIGAVISIYTQTIWVLVFLDLIKPQKLTEDTVVVPEIIN